MELKDLQAELIKVNTRIGEIEEIRAKVDTHQHARFRRVNLYGRPDGWKYVMRFMGQIRNEEYVRKLRARKRLEKRIRNG